VSQKPSTNLGGLLAVKGDAVSSMPVAAPAPALMSVPAVAAPTPEKPAAKKPAAPKPAPAPTPVAPTVAGGHSYWKAMTLRLGREHYLELKQFNLLDNQSSQDSLTEAVCDWLEKRSRRT
jgi:hypothetical protein